MANFAREFTPELNAESLAALLNPMVDQERVDIGNARREGAAAGLVGQAATGSRIGQAEAAFGRNKNTAVASFNREVADKQYGERMTDESRAFQDTERRQTEAFQQQMAKMGYEFQASQDQGELNAAQKAIPWSIAGNGLAAAIGGYAGRK